MRPGVLLVPLVAVALAACATAEPRGSAADDSFTVPSADKPGSPSGAPLGSSTFRGVLSADDIEGGCVFLQGEDGTRYEVVYPAGWVVDRAAVRLRGPNGEDVIAGTTIEVEGSIARDRSSICQVGPIVVATRVTPVPR